MRAGKIGGFRQGGAPRHTAVWTAGGEKIPAGDEKKIPAGVGILFSI